MIAFDKVQCTFFWEINKFFDTMAFLDVYRWKYIYVYTRSYRISNSKPISSATIRTARTGGLNSKLYRIGFGILYIWISYVTYFHNCINHQEHTQLIALSSLHASFIELRMSSWQLRWMQQIMHWYVVQMNNNISKNINYIYVRGQLKKWISLIYNHLSAICKIHDYLFIMRILHCG